MYAHGCNWEERTSQMPLLTLIPHDATEQLNIKHERSHAGA